MNTIDDFSADAELVEPDMDMAKAMTKVVVAFVDFAALTCWGKITFFEKQIVLNNVGRNLPEQYL